MKYKLLATLMLVSELVHVGWSSYVKLQTESSGFLAHHEQYRTTVPKQCISWAGSHLCGQSHNMGEF